MVFISDSYFEHISSSDISLPEEENKILGTPDIQEDEKLNENIMKEDDDERSRLKS